MKRSLLNIVAALLVIVVVTACVRWSFLYFYRAAYPVRYSSEVLENSAANGIEPALVFAVIRTESGFRPEVQSSVQATGLMQITPGTFLWAQMWEGEELEFEQLYDAAVNIRYGTVILRLLFEEFGTEELALCAYHAGWGSVKRWLDDPELSADGEILERIPFPDTAYYVDRVLKTRDTYKRLYGDFQTDSI